MRLISIENSELTNSWCQLADNDSPLFRAENFKQVQLVAQYNHERIDFGITEGC